MVNLIESVLPLNDKGERLVVEQSLYGPLSPRDPLAVVL